jgi:hypothetical protein
MVNEMRISLTEDLRFIFSNLSSSLPHEEEKKNEMRSITPKTSKELDSLNIVFYFVKLVQGCGPPDLLLSSSRD